MNNHGLSPRRRLRSFGYALRGLQMLLRGDNARLQLAAAVLTALMAGWLHCSAGEWAVIVVCMGGVLAAEALNTAIETLADRISPHYDRAIGRAKDVAAAGVLLTAMAAAVAGALIFVPKLLRLWS